MLYIVIFFFLVFPKILSYLCKAKCSCTCSLRRHLCTCPGWGKGWRRIRWCWFGSSGLQGDTKNAQKRTRVARTMDDRERKGGSVTKPAQPSRVTDRWSRHGTCKRSRWSCPCRCRHSCTGWTRTRCCWCRSSCRSSPGHKSTCSWRREEGVYEN